MNDISFNFNTDTDKLIRLGFTLEEINRIVGLVSNGFRVSRSSLVQLGHSEYEACRLVQLYNIMRGTVSIQNDDELIKHLRTINKGVPKIGMDNLKISKIREVPRVAVVMGITKEPYTIWNSTRYHGKQMLYLVRDVTPTSIVIETSRKPALKYDDASDIDGVLSILGGKTDGGVVISFNKDYCKLCNRYIIIASFRRPEFHLGMYEIICNEGTKVYVYATILKAKDKIKYNMATQRVYDYGVLPDEIVPKLKRVAIEMFSRLNGIKIEGQVANTDFVLIDPYDDDVKEETEI